MSLETRLNTHLCFVHFDETRVDFWPLCNSTDAPQCVRVLCKGTCLYLWWGRHTNKTCTDSWAISNWDACLEVLMGYSYHSISQENWAINNTIYGKLEIPLSKVSKCSPWTLPFGIRICVYNKREMDPNVPYKVNRKCMVNRQPLQCLIIKHTTSFLNSCNSNQTTHHLAQNVELLQCHKTWYGWTSGSSQNETVSLTLTRPVPQHNLYM